MNIQNLHSGMQIVDKDGKPTSEFLLFFSSFINQLQTNLSNEGYKLPKQSTAIITQLNTVKSEANLIYDNQLKKGFLNENGVFKEIVTM